MKNRLLAALVLFSIFVSARELWAQQLSQQTASETEVRKVQFSGTLRERGTKKFVPQANVFLLPLKLKAVTDERGRFLFPEVPVGQHDLVVNLTGYQKLESTLRIEADQENSVLYLEREFYSAFETTVTAKAKKRDDQQKSISRAEFLSAPGAGGDPVKAVQNLAGVNRSRGAGAQVSIQGAEPEDTRYSIDGHRVPLIFHFGGVSSIVFPEAVEKVNLYPAGYGPEYGRALGGQITLDTRDAEPDRWKGVGFVDFLNTGGLIEGPLSDSETLLVAGRYSYVGEILKAAVEKMPEGQDDFGLTVAPSFFDLTTIYRNQLSEKSKFRFTAVTSGDKVEFILKEPPGGDPALRGRFFNETLFFRLIPQWSYRLEDGSTLDFSFGVGKNKITFDVGSNYFRLDSSVLTLRGENSRQISSNWKTYLGFENEYVWYDLSIRLPDFNQGGGVSTPPSVTPLRDITLKDKSSETALYWRNEISDGPWTWMPGLRFDYFRVSKELLLQPRLAARLKRNETLSYRFALGAYHQPPTGQQINKDFGNPSLKSQRAIHLNVGLDKDFRDGATDGHEAGFGLFYKKLDLLVVRSSALVSRDGTLTSENYSNQGTGRIQGFESSWKYRSGAWTGGLAYTLAQSYRTEPGQAEYPSATDQTHNLNLLGSYETARWLLTSRFRFVTGTPFTAVVGANYDADADVYVPVRGPYYAQRNRDFKQLDLRAERKVIYDTWILSYYFDIQNLFNEKNIEGVEYSYDYKQRQDVAGLGLLPTFGVKGEF